MFEKSLKSFKKQIPIIALCFGFSENSSNWWSLSPRSYRKQCICSNRAVGYSVGKQRAACPRSIPWPGPICRAHIDSLSYPIHGHLPKDRPADATAGARAASLRPRRCQLSGEQPQKTGPRPPRGGRPKWHSALSIFRIFLFDFSLKMGLCTPVQIDIMGGSWKKYFWKVIRIICQK